VLPIFKGFEDHEWGESDYHGRGGEVHITDIKNDVHPLCQNFLTGAESIGYPRTDDFNGSQMEGVSTFHINTRKGWRASSSNAFLRPVMKRGNLQVRTEAHATRILFDTESGDKNSNVSVRATGVEYLKNGTKYQVTARKEVIVSGGAING